MIGYDIEKDCIDDDSYDKMFDNLHSHILG